MVRAPQQCGGRRFESDFPYHQVYCSLFFNKNRKKFFIYNIKVKKMTKFVVDMHDVDTRRDGRGFGKHDKDRHRHRVI